MGEGVNHTAYTREDIYDLLHSTIPLATKKLASKLEIDDVQGVGRISNGRVILGERLTQLCEEDAISHIAGKGWILKERIPVDLTIIYSEIFKSVQGEGQLMGIPSVFFRTTGCNLRCWFCDTPYTSHAPEVNKMSIDEAVQKILSYNCDHVVITGGEPFIQRQPLKALCGRLRKFEKHITIETNGTIFFDVNAKLLSISPKLIGSGPNGDQCGDKWKQMHEDRRINAHSLQQFLDQTNYQFKFVVTKDGYENVIDEIRDIQNKFQIPNDKIYLMPEGQLQSELEKTQEITIDACLKNGWLYSDRLHVRLWGNRRGV